MPRAAATGCLLAQMRAESLRAGQGWGQWCGSRSEYRLALAPGDELWRSRRLASRWQPPRCAVARRATERSVASARERRAGEEESRPWLRWARRRPGKLAGRQAQVREALRRAGKCQPPGQARRLGMDTRVTPLTASSTVRRCYGRVAVRRSGFQILLPRISLHEGGRD